MKKVDITWWFWGLLSVAVIVFFYIVVRPSNMSIILGSAGATVVTAIAAVGIERVVEVIWWIVDRSRPKKGVIKKHSDKEDPRRLLISVELSVLLGLAIARLLGINIFYGGSMNTPVPSTGWQWGSVSRV